MNASTPQTSDRDMLDAFVASLNGGQCRVLRRILGGERFVRLVTASSARELADCLVLEVDVPELRLVIDVLDPTQTLALRMLCEPVWKENIDRHAAGDDCACPSGQRCPCTCHTRKERERK